MRGDAMSPTSTAIADTPRPRVAVVALDQSDAAVSVTTSCLMALSNAGATGFHVAPVGPEDVREVVVTLDGLWLTGHSFRPGTRHSTPRSANMSRPGADDGA